MLNLRLRFLSDKDAERLYKKFPELKSSPDKFCPTCLTDGSYMWQGKEVKCDCTYQLQLYKHYLNSGIGVLYQRQSWDDFDGDPKLRALMKSYADNAPRMISRGINILLLGEFGVGKTMAMNLLLKELLHQGYSVFATTFTSMIEMFTAGWTSSDDKHLFQERMIMSQVLLIDDIGREMKTKTNLSESTFDYILRSRVQMGRPTFITSNMTESSIKQGYGSAVFSLLGENCLIQTVKGTDFRKKAGQRTLKEVYSGEVRPII